MRKIFEKIYANKVWYKGSGSGSLPGNTREYRKFLQKYIKDNNIKSVIDIGCGNWSFSKLIDWSEINYLGIDVVKSVVNDNIRKYKKKNINFKLVNILKMQLPKADLIVLKDVLQHWSNKNILLFLPKLNKYKHVLIINAFEREGVNTDIKNGEFRPVDLSKAPFNSQVENLLIYNTKRPIKKVIEKKSLIKLLNQK